MNIGNIIVGLILAAVIFSAVFKIIRDRKKGSACPGCGGCSFSASCTDKK